MDIIAAEKLARYTIVDFIKSIEPIAPAAKPKVYPYAIPPVGALLSNYKNLVVDAAGDINVVFVTLASFDGDKNSVTSTETKGADIFGYEIRHARGIAPDKEIEATGEMIVAADQFYAFLMQMTKKFDQDIIDTVNGTLGINNGVSHNHLSSQSIAPWGKLGPYDVYLSVMGINVLFGEC